ncbi:MAG: replicative DNA helicase, partial [Planctomycetes bacterium]|nr:replicative DNA helicase [Planctomycetota bacterium]
MPAERNLTLQRPEGDMPTESPGSQRVPPQSLEAEMGLLGSMALDRDVIGEVLQEVRGEHFYRPDHRLIFEVLLSLYEANKPVDLVLLRDELKRRGELEQVGGVDYLVRLVESVPSAANGVYYARIVRDKGILRDLIRVTGELCNKAFEDRSDIAELLNETEQKIFEVTKQTITGQPVQIREIMTRVYELIDQREKGITGFSTGFTELDDLMGGLQRGEMIVVAARPSMGKTALGSNSAEHIGVDNQK